MTSKQKGIVCLITPFALIVLAFAGYIAARMVTASFSPVNQFELQPTGLAPASAGLVPFKIISFVAGIVGSVGVLSFFIAIPFGIYFLTRQDKEGLLRDAESNIIYQGLSTEQIIYLNSWSWGAFFGSFIWALGNKLWWWALGSLVPFFGIYVWIKLSIDGRKMAWVYQVPKDFSRFQKRQTILGVIIVFLTLGWIVFKIFDLYGQR